MTTKKKVTQKATKKPNPAVRGEALSPLLENTKRNMSFPNMEVYERQIKPGLGILAAIVSGELAIVRSEDVSDRKE